MVRILIGRKEAEQIAGVALIRELDDVQAVETHKVLPVDFVEFGATLTFNNGDGVRHVTAYYYQHTDDLAECAELSDLNWVIEGYEII